MAHVLITKVVHRKSNYFKEYILVVYRDNIKIKMDNVKIVIIYVLVVVLIQKFVMSKLNLFVGLINFNLY